LPDGSHFGEPARRHRRSAIMIGIGAAQAQELGPLPDLSIWQVFAADPTFLVLNLVVLATFVVVMLVVRRRYARFYKIQRESLDHRKTADAQALAQNQSVEQLIARQYGVTNAHNRQALERAEEAMRISAETLAQITSMNQSLTRIAERLEHIAGPAA
jgi:hypothetical protein